MTLQSHDLPSPSMFDGLDEAARAELLTELDWFSLPGGQVLFEQGEPGDALYLVCSGELGVVIARGSRPLELVARVPVGEAVGEMALLTDRPRSATVIALRDTTLVRISRAAFERVASRRPGAMLRLTAQIAERLERTTHQPRATFKPRTIALLPLGPEVPIEAFAAGLAAALQGVGERPEILDAGSALQGSEFFHRVEAAHGITLYRGAGDDSAWTRLCLRRADRILYVSLAGAVSEPLPHAPSSERLPWRTSELVVLHPEDRALPLAGDRAPVPAEVSARHHVRLGRERDIARLARGLTGRAVGLVLSGGGARGYIHVGVVKALRELGVPIDLIGGTSFGAIVAACVAHEWDDQELRQRFQRAFVESSPLDDYTAPIVALTRGRKVTRRLRDNFGERHIEDLWLPFYAVAANISSGRQAIQRSGPIWRAVRASVAIPGLLPPVIVDGEVLVDGGVMNNVPTDVMRESTAGPVVAVDIAPAQEEPVRTGTGRRPWARRLFSEAEFDGVGILGILLRSATVSSEAQARLCREACDVLLSPVAAEVGLLDWRAFDRAVEAGYRYTMERADQIASIGRRG